MRRGVRFILLAAALCLLLSPLGAVGSDIVSPRKNRGKKWRIGYLEGGPYVNYPLNLRGLINGLAKIGWIQPINIPPQRDPTDTRELWTWLTKNMKSDYIELAKDGYWSFGWNKAKRKEFAREVVERLNKKDLDLMIAMGTWAGQELANDEHSVPTMVMSTSDPIGSKIIKSAHDSGYDHVHAKVDPTRYLRQLRIFHDIIGFKKLGVVYENTVEGRTYAAINDIETVARERGFEVVKCEAPFSGVPKEEALAGVIKCHKELAPKIDALYVTVHRGISLKKMPELLAPLFEYRIPTFSQRGPKEVKHGVLLSVSRASFSDVGEWHAKVVSQIFCGTMACRIDQIFEDPKKIVINLATAQIIEYDPPFALLGAADDIFEEIATATK